MSDLLPPNATALEHALADVAARIDEVPVPLRTLWSPVDCPSALLPWLAWALSVDDWDPAWSETQKRDTVATAIAVQQQKGTIGAVRTALAALGIEARVQEWFNQQPPGTPYTYKLYIDASQEHAGQAAITKAIAVADTVKSLRSHLEEVLVSVRSQSRAVVAAAALVGTEITTTGFDPGIAVINEHALAIG